MIVLLSLSGMFYCNPFFIITLNNQLLICHRESLHLYCTSRLVARLFCHVFGHVINNIQTPFLVYLDHDQIANFREVSILAPTGNPLFWTLRQIKLPRLRPINLDEYPYIVGVLIAS